MDFIFNDGGRSAAGYKGAAGDCVTRAVAIASGRPYKEVYAVLANGNAGERQTKRRKGSRARTARSGIHTTRKWFKDYMRSLGFEWVPTMLIGQGCKVHLRADELPQGRLVVAVSRHYTAVIDGVINDTYNPSEDRPATIYPHGILQNIPAGARLLENGNGWIYEPERCVYGYWILKGVPQS